MTSDAPDDAHSADAADDGEWITFARETDDGVSFISADAAFSDPSRRAGLDQLVRLNLAPSAELLGSLESPMQLLDRMNAIEEQIDAALAGRDDAVFVGRVTELPVRDLAIYAKNADAVVAAIREAIGQGSGFDATAEAFADPDWQIYASHLMPTPQEYRDSQTAQLLQMIEESGDDISQPRLIRFWAYFDDETAAGQFAKRAAAADFEADPPMPPNDEVTAWSVRTSVVSPLDIATLRGFEETLAGLAEQQGGTYDGWEAGRAGDMS